MTNRLHAVVRKIKSYVGVAAFRLLPKVEVDLKTRLAQKGIGALLAEPDEGTSIVVPSVAVEIHPHRLSVASDVAEEAAFYSALSFDAQPLIVDRLRRRYWFPEYGFVVSDDVKVWHHATLGAYADEKFVSVSGHLVRHFARGLTGPRTLTRYLAGAPTIKGLHVVGSHYASHNFGHFMLDMVPLLYFAKQQSLPILTRPLLSWQRQIYDLIGIDAASIREVAEPFVLVDDLLVSNRHNAVATRDPHPHHRSVFEQILANVPEETRSRQTKTRIFLSREGSESRLLRNRHDLVSALSELDFSVVLPQHLSVAEQAAVFAAADVIVTEFGAVMANAVYCKPGTVIIEIIPEKQLDPWSVRLCSAMQLTHISLFQKVDDVDRRSIMIGGRPYDNISVSFDASIDEVVRVTRAVISDVATKRLVVA